MLDVMTKMRHTVMLHLNGRGGGGGGGGVFWL